MGTVNDRSMTPASDGSFCHVAKQGLLRWLGRRRSLAIVAALAVGGVSLALWQHWLRTADLVPLLFTLPCAVMMFMCMKGMNHGERNDTKQAAVLEETTAADGPS